MTHVHSRTVTSAGYRIHLQELGQGPIVLMVHGFPESPHSWRHQMEPLAAAGYRAVAIDQLGFGRSSKPRSVEETRITRLVDIAVGVVEALGESTAAIMGHDWGSPVAWTAGWTRPDVFKAVIGVSVPFGGRCLMALPGNTQGDVRPSIAEAEIAGPGLVWYQQFIQRPQLAEEDAERDVRSYLAAIYYSLSADAIPPLPKFETRQETVEFLRGTAAVLAPHEVWSDRFATPPRQPDWLPDADLDVYVEQFEQTGFSGPFSYYRTNDLDWELLADFAGKPLTVPALFIGADRDVPSIWGAEAAARLPEVAPRAHPTIILEDCGHWIQQEKPAEFNRALLEFLAEEWPIGA